MKPVGLEKCDVRIRIVPTLQTNPAFFVPQHFGAGTKLLALLPNVTPKEPSILLRPLSR